MQGKKGIASILMTISRNGGSDELTIQRSCWFHIVLNWIKIEWPHNDKKILEFNRTLQAWGLRYGFPHTSAGAQQPDHWFAERPDRFMQLNIGAEMGLACLFS